MGTEGSCVGRMEGESTGKELETGHLWDELEIVQWKLSGIYKGDLG